MSHDLTDKWSAPFDWETAKGWDWKRRNLAVWDALEAVLNAVSGVLTTMQLAQLLDPAGDGKSQGDLASVLTRLAKCCVARKYVTHDGEEFETFGRKSRRYRWHGQLLVS